MARGNFERCHAVTAQWEGGWSNHPADPGGKTMYGVTEAVYHAWLKAHGVKPRPVKQITKAEAVSIYFSNYWRPVRGDTLAAGVDLAVYDAAVNSGVSRAMKWLLASIGGSDVTTVQRICAKRLGFVQFLTTWKTFGKGWANRIADIEARGVAWAGATKAEIEAEAAKANKTSNRQGGTGGAVGGGGIAVSPELADSGALLLFLLVAVGVAGFLIWRARINKARAKAYAAEAAKK